MYGYEWTEQYGIYRLTINSKIIKEIRPVFKEELDYFGMDKFWQYPETDAPLLWAEGTRRYIVNGICVAEAKGGGFYSKPIIEVFQQKLQLQPIDIDSLWQENQELMKGLEQRAIEFIREVFERYKKQGYTFVVAFSGGKDSLALLDLVSKSLSPNEFYVVFNNTGMELESTLNAVEVAKRHWSNLHFFEAKSHMLPETSWEEFGPPSRRLRWCCTVHKSAPTILKIREITGESNSRAVVLDGVRAEESAKRAEYDDVSEKVKNINQVNCHPILAWNSSEIFAYLLKNKILINQAYKEGFNRVGCTICPLSSGWRDSLSSGLHYSEISGLLSKVEQYAEFVGIREDNKKKYIETDGWRTRMGGRSLPKAGNRITEVIENNSICFRFSEIKQDWFSVVPLVGPIVEMTKNGYLQLINKQEFSFSMSNDSGFSVTYSPYSNMDRYIVSHLRGVANKVAYCIGCKACIVQCPTNAFIVDDNGKIFIREDKCIHCHNCIEFTNGKGCLVAKSLQSTQGGANMKLVGMDRYKTFGFRKSWLEHFFTNKSDCFTMGQLGNRQYDSLKVWLREAGLLSTTNKGERTGMPTPLFEKLEPLGPFNPLTWAVIWANLAYNSVIVKWYMLHVPAGEIYEKNDLVFMLGDDYSQSTMDNAVTALLETLRHSPIGSVLKQGIPIGNGKSFKYAKKGWETPEAIAILYSLYLWAEATGRYTFTLSQLAEARGKSEAVGIDPVSIYGLDPSTFKELLKELALHYEKYIRVTFVVDLDTVKLIPAISSLDILNLS